jgi:cytoskeletal protein CcmA (bactofilin family)
MGLFGRDDHADDNKPAPAEPQVDRRASQPAGGATTLIAKTNTVEGKITGSGEIRIEGAFKGKLDCSAPVIVAQGGEVEAELRAEIVTVAGRVHGNILAGHKIELTPSADVRGDITSPRILIREGASFEGQVFMADPNKPKPKAPEAKETPNSDSDKK